MVTGGMSSVPIICGYNSGQHFYYDVDPDGGHVKLTIDRSNITLLATWDIVIAQISCGSRYRAPEGCLQYYTATVGTISSFNFLPSNTPLPPGAEIVQLANQDYGVCIKRADDYCGIIYDRNTNDGDYSFTLSGDTNTLLPYLIGTFEANSRNEDCTTDYVVIPGGRYTMYANDITTFPADRYCGLGFPYTVTTTAQPFVLYFKTDGDELLDNCNRGFSLNYRQIISCV
nr:uncharacterized protein LOC128704818 [Cherax quadricarinatus]